MTIRQRLGFSFLIILALFALNQGIYFWSAGWRTETMRTLDGALTRRVILTSVRQQLDNLHKQVTLLGQIEFEEGSMAAGSEAQRLFADKLDQTSRQIAKYGELTEAPYRDQVRELADTYSKLLEAWKGFYQYLGIEQGVALAHLIRADPLTQQLLTVMIPSLEEGEQQRVETAQAEFVRVAQLTDRLAIGIFLLSVALAVFVAYFLSRHILRGCAQLQFGAARLGRGDFKHRIVIQTRDELGELASSFNDMAENLLSAQSQLTEAHEELEQRHQEVKKQQKIAESLLLNILPAAVAEELETKGAVEPRYFEDVTTLFTDFVGFTISTEKLAAEELVDLLHDYFTAFDQIIERYKLEKLKTIGDSYMCVGGLPVRNASHPVDAVLAAFEMVQAVEERDRPDNLARWAVRVGLHTGPVIAGVVGIRKFAFDIWGDSVNYASRMESSGAPNRINISGRSYSRVKDFFACEHRGKVLTKDKKEVDMYYVKTILPTLVDDTSQVPPPAFLRRYRAYFQKDPPAFPSFPA